MPIPANKGRGAYDWKDVSDENTVDTGTETYVQQQFQEEVDINTIVRRFGITGALPFGPGSAMYGDFTGITDFESAMELVKSTQERFMALPAELREKFGNNPGKLVKFAQESSEEEFLNTFAARTEPAKPAPEPETHSG